MPRLVSDFRDVERHCANLLTTMRFTLDSLRETGALPGDPRLATLGDALGEFEEMLYLAESGTQQVEQSSRLVI